MNANTAQSVLSGGVFEVLNAPKSSRTIKYAVVLRKVSRGRETEKIGYVVTNEGLEAWCARNQYTLIERRGQEIAKDDEETDLF